MLGTVSRCPPKICEKLAESEMVGGGGQDKPCQLFASLCLLDIAIGVGCCHTALQLIKPWDEVTELILDVLALLRWTCQQDGGAVWWGRTSECFMSAVIPPKQDLRGGKTSADSFAMSSSTFVTSSIRCFFAATSQLPGVG